MTITVSAKVPSPALRGTAQLSGNRDSEFDHSGDERRGVVSAAEFWPDADRARQFHFDFRRQPRHWFEFVYEATA